MMSNNRNEKNCVNYIYTASDLNIWWHAEITDVGFTQSSLSSDKENYITRYLFLHIMYLLTYYHLYNQVEE